MPALAEEARGTIVGDMLAARPISRFELQSWIDAISVPDDTGQLVDWQLSATVPRQLPHPAEIPTLDDIVSQFRAATVKLAMASTSFERWMGRPLFGAIADPPWPFDSIDPAHWFSGTVSYLSCIFFFLTRPMSVFHLSRVTSWTTVVSTFGPRIRHLSTMYFVYFVP